MQCLVIRAVVHLARGDQARSAEMQVQREDEEQGKGREAQRQRKSASRVLVQLGRASCVSWHVLVLLEWVVGITIHAGPRWQSMEKKGPRAGCVRVQQAAVGDERAGPWALGPGAWVRPIAHCGSNNLAGVALLELPLRQWLVGNCTCWSPNSHVDANPPYPDTAL